VQKQLPSWLQPVARVIDTITRFLWNVIRWPFDRLFDLLQRFAAGPAFKPLVVGLGLLTVAGVILLYRRGLRAAIVAQAELAAAPEALPLTAAEAIAAAQAHAAAGRHREACHFIFLSTLLWIEERGRVQFDRAATNREHLARLAREPALAAALAPVVARFDHLWYGQDRVTDSDYHDLLDLAGRVRELAA
jgi:hypothetical protein